MHKKYMQNCTLARWKSSNLVKANWKTDLFRLSFFAVQGKSQSCGLKILLCLPYIRERLLDMGGNHGQHALHIVVGRSPKLCNPLIGSAQELNWPAYLPRTNCSLACSLACFTISLGLLLGLHHELTGLPFGLGCDLFAEDQHLGFFLRVFHHDLSFALGGRNDLLAVGYNLLACSNSAGSPS
jgi:hypothetical protein